MFKINGIEMSSPTGCTWQLSDLSSDESGRSTRDGSMSKDIIAQKRTLSFTWTMLSWVEASKLATNAMGYYETVESQDDGSIICYMHDKENLSDSKTIWKKTVDGIFDCAVVLTKTNEDLRIVGISLQVAKLNIEGNTNLIIQRGTTKIINIVIYFTKIEILFVLDNSFYVKMWLIFFIKKRVSNIKVLTLFIKI